ncbi:hypothetical protein GH714_002711 [Hevea brasiliensis]|uniref:Retrotransposon gag domain-containing protein n=1 Tax=Hevea brasiliensis TaxID=3981 RepID=A0A6A6KH96_HEVBR|nr:hypothetical protein GH714_002711 [Hevea brasiliensis]
MVLVDQLVVLMERSKGVARRGDVASQEIPFTLGGDGDLDMWPTKVELHIADGEEKLEEMDNRIKELNGRLDEFREEVQVAFNAAIDKPTRVGSCPSKVKDVDDEMVIMKRAIAQGGVASPSTLPLAMPSKVEVPKQSSKGISQCQEIDNFLWGLEQYFQAIGIDEDARKIKHAPLYLADTTMVWWRRRHANINKGTFVLVAWDDFKKELRKQFYLDNAAHEARAKLRRLS